MTLQHLQRQAHFLPSSVHMGSLNPLPVIRHHVFPLLNTPLNSPDSTKGGRRRIADGSKATDFVLLHGWLLSVLSAFSPSCSVTKGIRVCIWRSQAFKAQCLHWLPGREALSCPSHLDAAWTAASSNQEGGKAAAC